VRAPLASGRVRYRKGCRRLSSGQRQDVGIPSLARRRAGKQAPIVTAKPLDSPICPGPGTFPDVVNDLVLEELNYVCAVCGARRSEL
jgi:hypothetical protein